MIEQSSIVGNVKDETGEPMPMLIVKVLDSQDSTMIKSATTSAKGRFRISGLQIGSYIISLSYVGYKTLCKDIYVTASSPSINLGTINIKPNDIMLKEAVIIGKKPDVVAKEDTLEFNADSYKTHPNSVVEDIIKNMPGMQVDGSGKITANGKTVTKILVDGKEFFSDDPKVASKNLPAKMVEKVQVIDRKSDEARFSGVDDGEEETVINLTVKKNMKEGWFGQLQGGGGTDGRFEANLMANRFVNDSQFSIIASGNNTNNMGAGDLGATMFSGSSRRAPASASSGKSGINTSAIGGINFNVRKSDKFNAGGDIKYVFSNLNVNERSERQNFINSDSTTYDSSIKENLNKSHNIEMNFRLKWQPNDLTNIDFYPSFGYNHSNMNSSSISQSTGQNTLLSLLKTDTITGGSLNSYSNGNGFNFAGRLSVSRKFRSKEGRQITISLSYRYNDSKEDGYSYNFTQYHKKNTLEELNLRDNNHNWSGSYGIRATYIEPINRHTSWSVAYNYRYNYTYADKLSFNIDKGGNTGDMNISYSNRFRNTFQRHKLSTTFNGTYTKMNYNVGIDLEPSKSQSRNLIDSNRNVEGKMQYNFSPFLRYTYKLDKTNNLRIDYRGWTQQPSISQLQPSQSISDPLRRTEGNPDLKASYNNTFRMRYNSYNAERQRAMMAALNGSYVINSIVSSTYYTPDGIHITKPVNETGEWYVNGIFLANAPFKNNKFTVNSFTNAGYKNQIGYLNSERNRSATFNVSEKLGFMFRSTIIDLGISGNGSFSRTKNSIQVTSDQNIVDYGGTLNTTIYLPGSITLASDINYNGTAGYSEGYNRQYWIWNAQCTWQFLKNKQASIIVRAYDILNQHNSITRSVTGTYIQDIETNSVGRYVMFSFAYRFNSFGGKDEKIPGGMQMQNNGTRYHGGGYGGRPMGPPPFRY
ncbi:MAG: TonB-dependent receptor [Bacteroidales bacterium]